MNKQIIKIISKLQHGIYFGLGLSLTIGIVGLTYAAISYSSLGGQTSGDPLSSTMWNKLYEHSVPVGFVGSFDLATCPTGWSEYTPARGRFIRGIDSSGTNDSVRVAGNTQEDSFKSHTHAVRGVINAGSNREVKLQLGNTNTDPTTNSIASANGGTETRPKNVALLFCEKN